MAKKESGKSSKGDSGNNKLCAILSYILIGVIWYFVDEKMKKDDFVKFHVKQGIILLIFCVIWSIILHILFGFFFFGFWYGMSFMWGIWYLLSYVPLIFVVLGILNALGDKEKGLPVIGQYAKNLTF